MNKFQQALKSELISMLDECKQETELRGGVERLERLALWGYEKGYQDCLNEMARLAGVDLNDERIKAI